jgi:hypothetical protein
MRFQTVALVTSRRVFTIHKIKQMNELRRVALPKGHIEQDCTGERKSLSIGTLHGLLPYTSLPKRHAESSTGLADFTPVLTHG